MTLWESLNVLSLFRGQAQNKVLNGSELGPHMELIGGCARNGMELWGSFPWPPKAGWSPAGSSMHTGRSSELIIPS